MQFKYPAVKGNIVLILSFGIFELRGLRLIDRDKDSYMVFIKKKMVKIKTGLPQLTMKPRLSQGSLSFRPLRKHSSADSFY